MITAEHRAHLRQTLGQMKHELGALQQTLENAPEKHKENGYEMGKLEGYIVDDYLLKFRLGNVVDLAHHTLEALGLGEKK